MVKNNLATILKIKITIVKIRMGTYQVLGIVSVRTSTNKIKIKIIDP